MKIKKIAGIVAIILAVLLIAFLNYMTMNKMIFNISDNCGVVANTLMHTIDSEDKCQSRCINQCDAQSMSYFEHEYTAMEKTCNKCICTCF